MIKSRYALFPWLLLIISLPVLSQDYFIRGTIKDSETQEPIAFANIYLEGTQTGTTSDINGNYSFKARVLTDSLTVSYVGYISQTVKLSGEREQTVDFFLVKDQINLSEVTFVAEENPAFAIMRNVVQNKGKNDRDAMDNFEHDTYTKIEFDVAQMAERFSENKLVKKVYSALDTVGAYYDENGKPSVPIFHSETISKVFIQNNPYLQKEEIYKANINGVGITDKKQVSQLTGVSFQQYNFYDNWMVIIKRDFVSPIADGWKAYYDYYLTDSLDIEGEFCYRIEFQPKNPYDLAFNGFMWITKKEYAIKHVFAKVDRTANLNFVDELELEQTLEQSPFGPWIPVRTKFGVKISELAPNMTGVTAKFLINASNYTYNKDYPSSFYALSIEVSDNVVEDDPLFWEQNRPEELNADDIKAIEGINSVKEIGTVNFIASFVKLVRWGYARYKWLDFGPWLYMYAYNNVEDHRFRFGMRTNHRFHEKVVLSGYAAYGTGDNRYKYGGGFEYVFSKKPWTYLSVNYRHDLEQLGAIDEARRTNYIFSAAARFGHLEKPHLLTESSVKLERDLFKGFTQGIEFTRKDFEPLFPFAYYENLSDPNSLLQSDFQTAEVSLTSRFARDEIFIYDNNVRFSLNRSKKPVFTFRFTQGIKNVFGSDFSYQKYTFRINQVLSLGVLGNANYVGEVGFIPTLLPFPLLKNHIGNNFIFYNQDAFNLMDKGEFVSDKYFFLKYDHHFQGYILNRIPLMKKLKWRLVATYNILYGGLRQANRDILPVVDQNGDPLPQILSVNSKPYMELGYGVENVFKVFRIEVFHRLSYLTEEARRIGIRVLFTVRP